MKVLNGEDVQAAERQLHLREELEKTLMRVRLEALLGPELCDQVQDSEHDLKCFRDLLGLHRTDLLSEDQEELFHQLRFEFWREAEKVPLQVEGKWVGEAVNRMHSHLMPQQSA